MSVSFLTRGLRVCALAPAVVVALATVAVAATPLPTRAERSVYDTAQVITDTDEASMEQFHRELYEKTRVAVVVITVPALVDETIDQLAVRVGQTWGVGTAAEDRGLVIAFARDDRKIFVATGYGTEEYLPDGKVGALLDREAIPSLRANRFSQGLAQLDRALVAESAAHYGVKLNGVPEPSVESSHTSTILTVIGFVFLILVGIRHPWLLLFLGNGLGGFGRRGGRGGRGGGFGGFGGGGFGGGGAGRDF